MLVPVQPFRRVYRCSAFGTGRFGPEGPPSRWWIDSIRQRSHSFPNTPLRHRSYNLRGALVSPCELNQPVIVLRHRISVDGEGLRGKSQDQEVVVTECDRHRLRRGFDDLCGFHRIAAAQENRGIGRCEIDCRYDPIVHADSARITAGSA